MNENSPICAMLMPARIDVRIPFPVKNALAETPIILPKRTTAVSAATGPQCCRMSFGSINIPHGDEEDRREHVAHRLHAMRDRFFFSGLGDERAREECTERRRIPGASSEQREHEADADAGDERRLGAIESANEANRARDHEQPDADEATRNAARRDSTWASGPAESPDPSRER